MLPTIGEYMRWASIDEEDQRTIFDILKSANITPASTQLLGIKIACDLAVYRAFHSAV